MARMTDHDLLTQINTHVEYIRADLKLAKQERIDLRKENQERKDWQENWDTRYKVYITVAASIGGVLVFVINKVWDFLSQKI